MIQRIQSLYLLLVAGLMVCMMSLPLGYFVLGERIDTLTSLSLVQADGGIDYAPWALFAVEFVVAVLALVSIFLFKKRSLQIRLSVFSALLLVGFYVTLLVFVWKFVESYDSFVPSWILTAPLVSIVFEWLAIRAIGKDIMLVKAYDRLR